MATITSTLQLLQPGDEIISINDLYGGTHTNFREFATHKNNIKFTFFDFKDLTKFKPLLNEKVKMVYVESATNPSLTVVDVPEVVKITREFNKDVNGRIIYFSHKDKINGLMFGFYKIYVNFAPI
jgi:O-acetylhomoserine/O-acetylserine sulfhydrylase-like pyridoxal-dependent enzyme